MSSGSYCGRFEEVLDLVPRHLAIKVLTEMGGDSCLTTAFESVYTSMQRRIRIGSALGECFTSTSSIIQGGLFEMLLLNGIFSCFFAPLEAEAEAAADGFADDGNITAVAPDNLCLQQAGRAWA